ncbi:MAG: RDD family protein [Acidobacteriota bacterium]
MPKRRELPVHWYYVLDNRQFGPLPDTEFQKLVGLGTITPATLVWREGMKTWQPLGQVNPGTQGGLESTSPASSASGVAESVAVCRHCGGSFAQEEMIQFEGLWICARCKPVFFQQLKEGVQTPSQTVYGGFWLRFGAKIIDYLLIFCINFAISLGLGLYAAFAPSRSVSNTTWLILFQLVQFVVVVAYSTWFLGKYGATPGKMACRLRVIQGDGSRIGYGRAFGRYFAEVVSALILMIGYLMAAFDAEKRALHDRMCNTRVVRS